MICPNTGQFCVYKNSSAPCGQNTCKFGGTPVSIPSPAPLIGWICPRCQRVHSPFIPSCSCNAPYITQATVSPKTTTE